MTEIAPLASTTTAAQHISEIVKNCNDISEIIDRLSILTGEKFIIIDENNNNNNLNNNNNNLNNNNNNNQNNNETPPETREKEDDNNNNKNSEINNIINNNNKIINYRDSDGRTAFHWALSLRRFDIANILRKKPYNCNIITIDNDNVTTINTACSVGINNNNYDELLLDLINLGMWFNGLGERVGGYDNNNNNINNLNNNNNSNLNNNNRENMSGGVDNNNNIINNINNNNNDEYIKRNTSFINLGDTAGNTPLLYLASRGDLRGLIHLLNTIPINNNNINNNNNNNNIVTLPKFNPNVKICTSSSSYNNNNNNNLNNNNGKDITIPLEDKSNNNNNNLNNNNNKEDPDILAQKQPFVNIFARNKRNQTLLHRAASRGAQDFIEYIILWMKKHTNINNNNNNNTTLIDRSSFINIINAQDIEGNTVLHYASMDNNKDMGEFLLRNGADRDIKNRDGNEFWKL